MAISDPAASQYIVDLHGGDAKALNANERKAFEEAFRRAFNKVCGGEREATTVAFLHWDGCDDLLDPRNGGLGFYHVMMDRALKLMDMKVPYGASFYCTIGPIDWAEGE
jgi:hypothetical protein